MTDLIGELSRGKKRKYTLEANGRPMGAARHCQIKSMISL